MPVIWHFGAPAYHRQPIKSVTAANENPLLSGLGDLDNLYPLFKFGEK